MRFSNAFTFPLPMSLRDPVADGARRVLAAPPAETESAPAPVRELPQDLDQRVREIGEW